MTRIQGFDPAINIVSEFDHTFSGGIGRFVLKVTFLEMKIQYDCFAFPYPLQYLLFARFPMTNRTVIDLVDYRIIEISKDNYPGLLTLKSNPSVVYSRGLTGAHRFSSGISNLRLRATHTVEEILEMLPFAIVGLFKDDWVLALTLSYQNN